MRGYTARCVTAHQPDNRALLSRAHLDCAAEVGQLAEVRMLQSPRLRLLRRGQQAQAPQLLHDARLDLRMLRDQIPAEKMGQITALQSVRRPTTNSAAITWAVLRGVMLIALGSSICQQRVATDEDTCGMRCQGSCGAPDTQRRCRGMLESARQKHGKCGLVT